MSSLVIKQEMFVAETEIYIENDEDVEMEEDPLRLELQSSEPQTVPNNESVQRKEPVVQNLNLSNTTENVSDEYAEQLQMKPNICKLCKQPYEISYRSNLIIRGFCKNCLYKTEKNSSNNVDAYTSSELSTEKVNKCHDIGKTVTDTTLSEQVSCTFCNETFTTKSLLNEHLKLRFNSGFSCDICKKVLCDSISLQKHNKVHAVDKANSRSFKDGLEVITEVMPKKLRQDTKINNKNIEKTNSTNRTSNIQDSTQWLKSEDICLSNENSLTDRNRKCTLCIKMFPSSQFTEHMKSHIVDQKSSPQTTRVTKSVESVHKGKDRIDNLSSPLTYKRDKKIDNLLLFTYKYLCEVCETNLAEFDLLKGHMESDEHVNRIISVTGMKLSCKQCNCVFNSINEFKSHLTIAEHVRKFHIKEENNTLIRCDQCTKVYVSKSDMTAHKYFKHGEVKQNSTKTKKIDKNKDMKEMLVECEKLDNYLINNLTEDISIVSTTEEPCKLSCSVCKRNFKSKPGLRKHLKHFNHVTNISMSDSASVGHTVKLPPQKVPPKVHTCEFCKKQFRYYSKLKQHNRSCLTKRKKVIVNRISDTCHKCSKCNNVFDTLPNYVWHKITESHSVSDMLLRMYCPECKVSFKKPSFFLRHAQRLQHIENHLRNSGVIIGSFCVICDCNFEVDQELETHVSSKSHINQYVKVLLEYNPTGKTEVSAENKL